MLFNVILDRRIFLRLVIGKVREKVNERKALQDDLKAAGTGKNILSSDERKTGLFVNSSAHYVWRKNGCAYEHQEHRTRGEARWWEHRDIKLLLCRRYRCTTHHRREHEWSDVAGHVRGEFDLISQKTQCGEEKMHTRTSPDIQPR